MNDAIAVSLFWMSSAFVLYTYAGYPGVLYMRRHWGVRPVKKEPRYMPRVTFVILAYNEENVLGRKLENTLALDYPAGRLEILVASDGSTDRTAGVVHSFHSRGVSLKSFPVRRGKTQVLNDIIPSCTGEIVVLSDARQLYAATAVKELAANFYDRAIGAVTGDLQFQAFPDGTDGEQIGLYWKYEKWIRRLQSETDSTPVVTGAIYAIRKAAFRPLPPQCIADDLAMPMSLIMRQYRVVFERHAKAYDYYSPTLMDEFRKRIRTIAGSYQYVAQVPAVLNPAANRIYIDFMSHKVCRLMIPLALIMMLASNAVIAAWPYRVILLLQMLFYALAGMGAILAKKGGVPKALSAPYTFLMLNVAATIAFFKLLTGTQTHLWNKPERAGQVQ